MEGVLSKEALGGAGGGQTQGDQGCLPRNGSR